MTTSEDPGRLRCGACGTQNREFARFCRECGAELPPAPAVEPAVSDAPAPAPPTQTRRIDPRVLVIAGLVALAVGVLVGVRILTSGDEGAATPTLVPVTAPSATATVEPTATATPDRGLERTATMKRISNLIARSHAGVVASRAGRWQAAASNRAGIIRALRTLDRETAEVPALRAQFQHAMRVSREANLASAKCADVRYPSGCSLKVHERASREKARLVRSLNPQLAAVGLPRVKAGDF